jgi:phosphatidylinositol alpha-1,6-mannosyltransferase
LRTRVGAADGRSLLFSAGRLVRKKGFEYLIDAVALMPPAQRPMLVLAGDGDLRAELEARAATAAIDESVRFLGNQTQDEVGRWLAAADVVAVPSVRDDSGNVDGLPNVVLEALASGTPLVTTAAGGIGSVVESGRTGLIVAERDPAGLAAAIGQLTASPELRSRIGEAARALVMERYGWERTARQLDGVYRRALAK